MFAGEGFLTNDMLLRGVQRGPSGRGTQFVDIKFKLSLQYTLLILDIYYYFKVNKSLSSELHNQKRAKFVLGYRPDGPPCTFTRKCRIV